MYHVLCQFPTKPFNNFSHLKFMASATSTNPVIANLDRLLLAHSTTTKHFQAELAIRRSLSHLADNPAMQDEYNRISQQFRAQILAHKNKASTLTFRGKDSTAGSFNSTGTNPVTVRLLQTLEIAQHANNQASAQLQTLVESTAQTNSTIQTHSSISSHLSHGRNILHSLNQKQSIDLYILLFGLCGFLCVCFYVFYKRAWIPGF